jgi:hypothetical protein
LSPPFESLGQLWVALAEFLQIVAGINRVGQRRHHIGDDKPPFVVVDDATDFLALKQRDALCGIGFKFAHSQE